LQATHQAILIWSLSSDLSPFWLLSLLAWIIRDGDLRPSAKQRSGHSKNSWRKELSIAVLLSKEFLRMLFVSILIGAPLSYFVNNMWLQKLPNRVEFGFGTVFLGTLILLVLGLITIGSQTLRASRSNPVDALKVE
jgi:putative ABC transport system permease protein